MNSRTISTIQRKLMLSSEEGLSCEVLKLKMFNNWIAQQSFGARDNCLRSKTISVGAGGRAW